MKKFPWGILAGACAMLYSFVTIAIVAVFVISGMMYSVAGSDDGLRESWWLIICYVLEVISVLGFGVSLFFFIRNKRRAAEIQSKEEAAQ